MFLKNKKIVGIIFSLAILFSLFSFFPVRAETIDEELAEIAESLRLLDIAEAPLRKELNELRVKLANIKKRIQAVEAYVNKLEEDIQKRSVELVYQKELFDKRVRYQYMKQQAFSSPLLLFFATADSPPIG